MEAKVVSWICYGPPKESKLCLDTIQTTFSENNNYYWAILEKSIFVMPENASFQGYFTEVSFDTSDQNQLSFFQNGYFFKILW